MVLKDRRTALIESESLIEFIIEDWRPCVNCKYLQSRPGYKICTQKTAWCRRYRVYFYLYKDHWRNEWEKIPQGD